PKSQKNPQYAPNENAAELGADDECDTKTDATSSAHECSATTNAISPASEDDDKPADIGDPWGFSRKCSDVALVWKSYMERAQLEDKRLADILTSDLDPLLLFATLFSAILVAFLIEVRKGLAEDLQDVTNILLTQVIATLQDQGNSGDFQPTSFAPTLAARSVNALWFLSLVFSLTSALGASIAKGWITQFSLADSGLYWANVEAHVTRSTAIDRFHVKWIIQSLSLLMHFAFFLFVAGLSLLLFTNAFFIGALIAVLSGVVFMLYLVNTVYPVFSATSPFHTPLTRTLRGVFQL
ncbi:hypothetical protein C8R45DRAFT_1131968, partial [Mycena sanguinolenta]